MILQESKTKFFMVFPSKSMLFPFVALVDLSEATPWICRRPVGYLSTADQGSKAPAGWLVSSFRHFFVLFLLILKRLT